MTINIRSNVFETNSSSSHSVSLHFPLTVKDQLETIEPNTKGEIHLDGGDFASTEIDVSSPIDKANFVAAYIMVYGNEDLKQRFEEVLLEHTGAKKIVYNLRFTYSEGKKANTFFSPEYSNAEDCGYYGDYYDSDEDESEESEKKSEHPVEFSKLVKSKEKLKVFLFSNRAKIDSEISYG